MFSNQASVPNPLSPSLPINEDTLFYASLMDDSFPKKSLCTYSVLIDMLPDAATPFLQRKRPQRSISCLTLPYQDFSAGTPYPLPARGAVVSLAVVIDGVLGQMQVVGKILAQLRLCDSPALVSAFIDIPAERFSEFQVAECQVAAILADQAARSASSHGWSPLVVWWRHDAIVPGRSCPVRWFGIS